MKKKGVKVRGFFEGGALYCSLFGIICAVAYMLICLTVFSAILLALENPHTALAPFAFFSLYTSAFIGGFASAKKNKGRDALLCGLVSGGFITLLFSVIFWIIGLILGVNSALTAWIFRALIAVFALIGAFVGSSKMGSTPKKKRHRRK